MSIDHERSQRIVLARHAETEWSITGQHTGRIDIDPEIDDDLLEWNYGDYEGVTTARIRADCVLDLWNDRSHLTSAIEDAP